MATFKIEINCTSREQMEAITNAICYSDNVRDYINDNILLDDYNKLVCIDPHELTDTCSGFTKVIDFVQFALDNKEEDD